MYILGLLGHLSTQRFGKNETIFVGKIISKKVESTMNFITWILNRIKNSMSKHQFAWVRDYRECILHDKMLSIFLTVGMGILYILLVTVLSIPFVDREGTFRTIICGLVASVVVFYVYNWIMALHEVYLLERQKTWDALSKR